MTKHIIFLGNKGGVGKTTVTANTAMIIAGTYNKKVGIIDLNISSPVIPSMLGVADRKIGIDKKKLIPVKVFTNLHIVSNEFFIPEKDMAVVMRKEITKQIIRQFIYDVDWEGYDYILYDTPSSISDEILTAHECIGKFHSSVLVSTSQDIALHELKRIISFTTRYGIKGSGVVENMFGFKCAEDSYNDLYKRESFADYLKEKNINIISSIPFDREILISSDIGVAFIEKYRDSSNVSHFNNIAKAIIEQQ